LENVIYRSAVIAQGDTILWKDLPPEIREAPGGGEPVPAAPPVEKEAASPPPANGQPVVSGPESAAEPVARPESREPPAEVPAATSIPLSDVLDLVYARLKAEDKEPVLERLEREMIARVLKDENGNLVRASERLGMTRTTLRKRIDSLGLKV
jgi:DNA-binding NtrC family response regulator